MKITFSALLLLCAFTQLHAKADPERLCPPDQHWVTAHPRRAYTKSDGVRYSASHVSSSCHPNPVGYAKWKDRFANSKPTDWTRTKEKQKKWTIEERERVLEALADLPDTLITLDSIQKIYRFERSQDYDKNPASGEVHLLGIYDKAFSRETNLARVLAHELAHELFRQFPVTEKARYAKENGWTESTDPQSMQKRFFPNRIEYVEEDSAEDVTEDFSNNIEHYLFNADHLRSVAPSTFKWIHTQFGDKFKLRKGATR